MFPLTALLKTILHHQFSSALKSDEKPLNTLHMVNASTRRSHSSIYFKLSCDKSRSFQTSIVISKHKI